MLKHLNNKKEADPITQDIIDIFNESHKEYGAPKIKHMLARRGIIASRRRITRIMHENNLISIYSRSKFKQSYTQVNEADIPNILDREFNGYKPHTHIVSDLTYVRIGRKWNYVCLLIDLYNREIVGHAAAEHKDANLVKAAFATLNFPLFEIEVFHTDRGSEFDNYAIDEMLEVFNIKRSLSKKGCPYDNAVVESANKSLKSGLIYRQTYTDINHLRQELNYYVWWYNNKRIHSTLNYLTPVEFREAGLSL